MREQPMIDSKRPLPVVGTVVPSGRPAGRGRFRRRGISTLWLIVTMPIFLLLLTGVVILGNVWLARVELENGLESAALAAVKEWGRAGGGRPTEPARLVGVAYAASNTISGQSIQIVTNLDPAPLDDNPNENLLCCFGKPDLLNGLPPTGNLIFGTVFEEENPLDPEGDPLIVFNAGIPGGCGSEGDVFLDIFKTDGGNSADPRMLGIFFDDGEATLSIQSISYQLPIRYKRNGDPVNAQSQPYWDALKEPPVSIREDNLGPDELNRFNNDPDPNNSILEPYDVRGIDWHPISPPPGSINVGNQQTVQSSALWTNYPSPTTSNPNGDIWFTFSEEIVTKNGKVLDDRWRTLTIHFTPGTFTSTGDPNTTDFVRFGAAFSNLQPDTPMGDNNDGDAFGILGVRVLITFFDSSDNSTSETSGQFVNVDRNGDGEFDDGWSEVGVRGTGGGLLAVRAQALHPVRNPISRLCGCEEFGTYYVPVKTTAVYDCALGRSRLVRIDKFICPGPEESP